MNDSSKKKLDDLVNEFYEYGQRNYSESSNSRKEINHLYTMKEHWKNGTKDSEGKIPTAGEIGYIIYYLRWKRILPF
tara:strand:- start:1093 stop:1323 length:231 start_codon:yes stop_codon:yes gene_type:complete